MALEIHGICKSFRKQRWPFLQKPTYLPVLKDVSLHVNPGQLFSISGPNGAGKTTLLKILAGLITPDSGRVSIDDDHVRFVSGDERSFYWRLTARQNLSFFATLEGLSPTDAQRCILNLAKEWKFTVFLDRPFEELSTGVRQRLALARGLMKDGSIFLADEPTRSLDQESKERFYAWLRQWTHDENKIALISSHHLDEVKKISDQMASLDQGLLRLL